MSSRTGAIECRSLVKTFDGRTAVDNVSFDVPAGMITGFAGANGAGKTTTMRMIVGLVPPSAGIAWVNGRPYRDLRQPRREVGAVIDGPGAHPGHSARTHLAILATAAGLPRRRVDEVLNMVGLTEHAHRRVGGFSMGMLQRLALAGALLGDPGILILDEPVNGLDPSGILWIRDLLRQLAEEGRALLISSHLLSELAEIAHRVVIIDRGRLVADSTLDDLLAEHTHVVELRCANPAPVVEALTARNIKVVVESGALIIEEVSAREVGATAAAVDSGPVYWLAERTSTFEDVYFRLAGSSTRPSTAEPDLAVTS